MTSLSFEPVNYCPIPETTDDDDTCRCAKPDSQYRMDIDEGQISLVHVACGRAVTSAWGDDWRDMACMDDVPVTVVWEPNCDGSMWHGEDRCDCGSTIVITPQAAATYERAKQRVTALHAPVEHMGQTWCGECSVRRSTGTRSEEWVAFIPYPCPTIDALENKETP